MTIFNKNNIDFTKQPMFFGEQLNIQRYDVNKYPVFEKLTEKQLSLFWLPQEISLQKDRNDYATMRPEQKFIFTKNLKYQTALDSINSRIVCLLPYVSLPELESCIQIWSAVEMIHSRSYTHIIRNLYPNPGELFDEIVLDPAIINRANSITKYYDDFLDFAKKCDYENSFKANEYELKKRLYKAIVAINILEGIRFYVSFACSFAFGELKLLEGSSKILSLIARDENVHLSMSQNIIKMYKTRENDAVMNQVIKDVDHELYEMYDIAINEEKQWAKHLFQDGSIIGLNETLLCQFIEHITNKRMKAIGLEPRYNQSINNNPLPWINNWLNSENVQVSPQESEIISYKTGIINQNITDNSFDNFKL